MKKNNPFKISNILMWALSLVIAVALWGYVAFYLNPPGDRRIDNIPVEFENEQKLTNNDLMLVNGRDVTVSVRVSGRLQDYMKVSDKNLKAVVDVSTIRNRGDHAMTYKLVCTEFPTVLSALTESRITSVVTVTVDKITSRDIPFVLDRQITADENFQIEPEIFDPLSVNVTGPASLVDTIDKAVVRYKQDQPISRTAEVYAEFTLLTRSGAEVKSDLLTLDTADVWLVIPVSKTKIVPLTIDIIDGGGITDKNIKYEVTPPTVLISGDPAILDGINSIPIATVYLSELEGNTVNTYPVTVPNDTKKREEVETAQVDISIIGASTRPVIATSTSITPKGLNLPEGYTYELVTKQVSVTLRSVDSEELFRVQSHNVRIVVDFLDEPLTPGYITKEASISVDGFEAIVGVVDKNYEVTLNIIPIPPEVEEETP